MWSVRWRDGIDAFVTPGHVDIVCRPRSRGLRNATPLALRVERQAGDASLAERLTHGLQSVPCQGAVARVVLSNHYVRYAALPLGGRLTTAAEREIAARFALRDTFHELADEWWVGLGDTGPASAIAAGVNATVIDDVLAAFAALGTRVASIEPLLARCVNAISKADRPPTPFWLVCYEPTWVVTGRVTDDGIQTLRSHRVPVGESFDFRRGIDQARLSEGLAKEALRVVMFSTERPTNAVDDEQGWLLSRVAFDPEVSSESLS